MLLDLNLPIHEGNNNYCSKSIEKLKKDIIDLCNYIKRTENRTIITQDDIENCEWCSDYSTYLRRFKKDLGYELCEFIESIGFRNGVKFIHIFDDGELVKSKYEFITSTYFRSESIDYVRNIPYKEFVEWYDGKKIAIMY